MTVRDGIRCVLLAAVSTCLAGLPAASAANPADKPNDADRSRVLILGDSISIGYTPFVQKRMADEAVVRRPMRGERAENCQGTTYGVKHVDRWLKIDGGRWDVIHFNFGLHDIKRVDPQTGQASNDANDPRQAELETYEKQLREIVRALKASGATLVFATTTPYPEGVSPRRDVADAERYNAVARRIMKEHGVGINDLYGFAKPRLEEIQRPKNVHFTPAGSEALAAEVATQIRAALKAR
jgi:acyl-CoA thioesterase-1